MNLIIVNTQSFGDILLSSHIGRVAKKHFPECKVHLFVRDNLTITTAENDKTALFDSLKVLSLQENIATAGIVVEGNKLVPVYQNSLPLENVENKSIVIQGWSSDYGIVESQLKPFYDLFNIKDAIDTETQFNVGSRKTLTIDLIVGLAGDLDFLRKWHNKDEYQKFINYITSKKFDIKIERFGRDVETTLYSEQLKRLNNCDLLISPMGSLIHAAAGLYIDTISLTSVFPAKYDCPEFYHSGWHQHVKAAPPAHCGNFKCVTEKQYDNQQTWGNPPTEFGFWPKECPHTQNKMSCNFNITADSLIEKFDEWYDEQ
jgi:hypothetical protein